MSGTVFPETVALFFRPISSLSYALNYAVWGMNPVPFHLTDVLIHVLATLALYALASVLGLRPWAAAIGAATFALHPVMASVVPNLPRRHDSLAAAGVFAALALAAWVVKQPRWSPGASLAIVLAALSLGVAELAKEVGYLGLVLAVPTAFAAAISTGGRVRDSLGRIASVLFALGLVTADTHRLALARPRRAGRVLRPHAAAFEPRRRAQRSAPDPALSVLCAARAHASGLADRNRPRRGHLRRRGARGRASHAHGDRVRLGMVRGLRAVPAAHQIPCRLAHLSDRRRLRVSGGRRPGHGVRCLAQPGEGLAEQSAGRGECRGRAVVRGSAAAELRHPAPIRRMAHRRRGRAHLPDVPASLPRVGAAGSANRHRQRTRAARGDHA